jgi:hypothetical protein
VDFLWRGSCNAVAFKGSYDHGNFPVRMLKLKSGVAAVVIWVASGCGCSQMDAQLDVYTYLLYM